MNSKLIVKNLFQFQFQLKLYHWQTRSFSRHKATDELTVSLLKFIDTFIESFQGKYGRVESPKLLEFGEINDSNAMEYLLDNFLLFLDDLYIYLEHDQFLLNQIDEIKTDVTQTRYRFTLN